MSDPRAAAWALNIWGLLDIDSRRSLSSLYNVNIPSTDTPCMSYCSRCQACTTHECVDVCPRFSFKPRHGKLPPFCDLCRRYSTKTLISLFTTDIREWVRLLSQKEVWLPDMKACGVVDLTILRIVSEMFAKGTGDTYFVSPTTTGPSWWHDLGVHSYTDTEVIYCLDPLLSTLGSNCSSSSRRALVTSALHKWWKDTPQGGPPVKATLDDLQHVLRYSCLRSPISPLAEKSGLYLIRRYIPAPDTYHWHLCPKKSAVGIMCINQVASGVCTWSGYSNGEETRLGFKEKIAIDRPRNQPLHSLKGALIKKMAESVGVCLPFRLPVAAQATETVVNEIFHVASTPLELTDDERANNDIYSDRADMALYDVFNAPKTSGVKRSRRDRLLECVAGSGRVSWHESSCTVNESDDCPATATLGSESYSLMLASLFDVPVVDILKRASLSSSGTTRRSRRSPFPDEEDGIRWDVVITQWSKIHPAVGSAWDRYLCQNANDTAQQSKLALVEPGTPDAFTLVQWCMNNAGNMTRVLSSATRLVLPFTLPSTPAEFPCWPTISNAEPYIHEAHALVCKSFALDAPGRDTVPAVSAAVFCLIVYCLYWAKQFNQRHPTVLLSTCTTVRVYDEDIHAERLWLCVWCLLRSLHDSPLKTSLARLFSHITVNKMEDLFNEEPLRPHKRK